MRRRVVCPRSHPASPYARGFWPLALGSQCFSGGTTPRNPPRGPLLEGASRRGPASRVGLHPAWACIPRGPASRVGLHPAWACIPPWPASRRGPSSAGGASRRWHAALAGVPAVGPHRAVDLHLAVDLRLAVGPLSRRWASSARGIRRWLVSWLRVLGGGRRGRREWRLGLLRMSGSAGLLGCLQGGSGSDGIVQDHWRGWERILELGWQRRSGGDGRCLRVAERYLLARYHWGVGAWGGRRWLGGLLGLLWG
jgi:hypothetical protein